MRWGPEPFRPDPAALAAWLGEEGGGAALDGAAFPDAALGLGARALLRARGALEAWLGPRAPRKAAAGDPDPLPGKYFGFLPTFEAALVPGGDPVHWEGGCFEDTSAQLVAVDGGWHIELSVKGWPKRLLCSDAYVFATPAGLKVFEVFVPWTYRAAWHAPGDAGQRDLEGWYIQSQGLKVFRFPKGFLGFAADLLKTLFLFEPMVQKNPPAAIREANYDFVAEYSRIKPRKEPRTAGVVEIPEEAVGSGDFFGIFRADGVDPMLAWGMGSSTGHTTVALRTPEGLHVCESQDKGAYWDTNGIQCTPFQTWLKKAHAAGYDVVHAPLSPEYRAKFDEAKAWEWFQSVEGLNYGFHNMLWGWVDTVKNNYPCTPPDYQSTCMSWPLIEVAFGLIDALMPSTADLMWRQAWALRVGEPESRLSTLEIYRKASEKGMSLEELPTVVEQDDWIYNTTRYGKPVKGRSMVCCVFVCAMWKAAGIFEEVGDAVNCAEFVNEDVYQLNVFDDPANRPEACKQADPDNQVCQLMGEMTLNLNMYNSRPMLAHMAEHCPSLAPDYERPAGC